MQATFGASRDGSRALPAAAETGLERREIHNALRRTTMSK